MIKKYKNTRSLGSLEELRIRYSKLITKISEDSEQGPLCCFWIKKLKPKKKECIEKYLEEMNDFRNYVENYNEFVIGCSRGCVNLNDNFQKIYWEKLCKKCVGEVKEIIENQKYSGSKSEVLSFSC